MLVGGYTLNLYCDNLEVKMNYQGNIKNLPFTSDSIDLIFTDPPYLKKYIPCYDWLAREAMRVLKPGGFVMAMTGGSYLNQLFRFFDDAGLSYYWEFHHIHNGDAPYIWHRHIIAKSKSILCYSKGAGTIRVKGCQSRYESIGKMKQYHHWGQDVASARYYIDHFSKIDDLVLDPFIGGGTTAVACALIGRRFINGDTDLKSIIVTRDRLNGENAPLRTLPMFETMGV